MQQIVVQAYAQQQEQGTAGARAADLGDFEASRAAQHPAAELFDAHPIRSHQSEPHLQNDVLHGKVGRHTCHRRLKCSSSS